MSCRTSNFSRSPLAMIVQSENLVNLCAIGKLEPNREEASAAIVICDRQSESHSSNST